jgi:hypothetical protein
MRYLYLTKKPKKALRRQGKVSKGIGGLPMCIFMAWVTGFPLQTQAQTPCPRASQCLPDGVLTVTFSVSGDTSGCQFTGAVNWGDGVIDTVSHIVDGQTMTHTYVAPGTYTVHITGAGTPTSPGATCMFNPNTLVTVQTHVPGVGVPAVKEQ